MVTARNKVHWIGHDLVSGSVQQTFVRHAAHSVQTLIRYMKASIVALLLCVPISGISQKLVPEVLFIGNLEKLELIPRGRPGCPEPRGREGQVLVSNSCGCGSAKFRNEVPVVPKRGRRYTVNYDIGEGCEANIRLFSGARFLVHKTPNIPYRWIEAVETSGGNHGFFRDQLDLLLYDFGIESNEIDFGSETAGWCEEGEEDLECTQEPVVLIGDLVSIFHVSKGSTGRP